MRTLFLQRYLAQDNFTHYTCVFVTFMPRHNWARESNTNQCLICYGMHPPPLCSVTKYTSNYTNKIYILQCCCNKVHIDKTALCHTQRYKSSPIPYINSLLYEYYSTRIGSFLVTIYFTYILECNLM